MRMLEVAIATIFITGLLLSIPLPPISGMDYEQRFVLANDIYLTLYSEFGLDLYEYNETIGSRLDEISQELALCIEFDNGIYSHKTCEAKDAVFIERDIRGRKVLLGVGK